MGNSSSSRTTVDNSLSLTNADENSGVVIGTRAALDNSNIVVTDHGAVKGAFEFGANALAANDMATQAALSSNLSAMDMAIDLAGDALGLGFGQSGLALANADKQVSTAIGTVGAQASTVANYMRDTARQVGELAKSFQSEGQSDQQKIYIFGALAGLVGIVAVAYILRGAK